MAKHPTAQDLFNKTCEGYSFYRYAPGAWMASIKMLLDRGFNDQQVEAIMLSKWTRWASDMSDKPYGKVNSKCLAAFLDSQNYTPSHRAVAELLD